MAVQDYLRDSIAQHIGPLKGTPSGWQKRNCMLCHLRGHGSDKRERFGIIYPHDGGVTVNCFNCGFGTGWKPSSQLGEKMVFFLSAINVPQEDINRLKFEAFREANDMQTKEFVLKGSITGKWKEIDFLEDCHPLRVWADAGCDDKDFLQVVSYAHSRNMLDLDKMYWTPSKGKKERSFNRRFVIPFTYKDKIVGWSGRLASDSADKSVPKYLSQLPPSYIYGLDAQQDYDKKYVIVSEGLMDAVLTDGIGVLHNNINADQVALLNSLPGQKILCPDRDKDGGPLIEIAIENKWHVAFPHWGRNAKGKPVKDAAEAAELFGQLLTIKSIIDSKESDSYAIRVKRKLDEGNYGY